jgi:CRP-like cAMP-binding protein
VHQGSVGNRLLQALPASVYNQLRSHLRRIELPLKSVLVHPSRVTSHVYFLESGLGSVIANSADGRSAEVGHIGFEGMAGSHVALMSRRTHSTTLMQVAGSALALPVARFIDVFEANADARRIFLRYVQSYQTQLAYTALANGGYTLHQRLARWLLMSHDRLRTEEIPLTHEFLSIMLAVRRSGVTDNLHILEGLQAIRSHRGVIHIRDREKLLEIAGASYGTPEEEYERLIGASAELKTSIDDTGASERKAPTVTVTSPPKPLCDPIAVLCWPAEEPARMFEGM